MAGGGNSVSVRKSNSEFFQRKGRTCFALVFDIGIENFQHARSADDNGFSFLKEKYFATVAIFHRNIGDFHGVENAKRHVIQSCIGALVRKSNSIDQATDLCR